MWDLKINLKLLPMKAHYFLWNAGTGPVTPFLSTYARQLGFSSVIVGFIYTILPICGMLAKPIIGGIADRFKCQKIIFLTAQLITIAAFLSIFYAPKVPQENKVNVFCDAMAIGNNQSVDETLRDYANCQLDCLMEENYWNNLCQSHPNSADCESKINDRLMFVFDIFKSHIDLGIITIGNNSVFDVENNYPICLCNFTNNYCDSVLDCNIFCNNYLINNNIGPTIISDDEVYGMYQFWIFLCFMIIFWVGQAITVSVGDTICFELLGDQHHHYGRQRMYGSLGWGIFATIAGVMVDALSTGETKNYISAFYLGCSIILIDFIVSTQIKYVQHKHSTTIIKDISRLLVDLRIIIFIIWCIIVGMLTALIWQFLFWLIEDLAIEQNLQNWVKTIQGLISAIQCLLGELPFFFLSSRILKKIGHVNSMTLVLFVFGIRFILYSVITNPWWFLPVELLSGLTFGLLYSCMTSYASIVSPKGTSATMQGIVGAVFEGVGVSLGSLITGVLYSEYGGEWAFRIFGIAALIVCLLHAGLQFLISRKYESTDFGKNYYKTKEILENYKINEQELALIS